MPKELEGQTQGFEDSTENDLKNQKQKNKKTPPQIHPTTAQVFDPNNNTVRKTKRAFETECYSQNVNNIPGKKKKKETHENTKTQC